MEKTQIEINGVKFEVDMRHATRIDTLRVGDRIKVLVKKYQDYAIYPGVVVGFENFAAMPSILVAYMDVSYSGAGLSFVTFNSSTKDVEIVKSIDDDQLELNREDIIQKMDRDIAAKEIELEAVQAKKAFFIAKFGQYFSAYTKMTAPNEAV
jgi:hypothetical protein